MKQRILVTGASSGLGLDLAQTLLAQGHKLFVAARRVDKMQTLVDQGAVAIALDISDEQQVLACAAQIEAAGGIDVLINNAGFGSYGSLEEMSIDDARYQFEVNLFGLARLTQLLLPGLREQGSGRIINMSSMGGRIYTPLGGWYYATKHALEAWSDCLRIELKQFNIQVVVIQPGIIETGFAEVLIEPMLQRSGQGPYQKMAQGLARSMARNYRAGTASKPAVITELVLRAINAKRPKTRYSGGNYARLLMFIRKWFGDRIYDRVILSGENQ